MTQSQIENEEERLFNIFKENPLPINRGIILDFLPSDSFIRKLTSEFGVEFAAVFTLNVKYNYLYVGNKNSISLPILTGNNHEILIKHSHPGGTELPSIHDINWLKVAQEAKSPQKKSTILPNKKKRTHFNINSRYTK